MTSPSAPTWIIFDAADTLLRAEPSVAVVYHDVARAHGVCVSPDLIQARFQSAIRQHFNSSESSERGDRDRWQQLVQEVLGTDHPRVFAELWDHFAAPSSWKLFDDVRPAWEWLEQHHFSLAIASNFDARLHRIVASLSPINRAQHVFISSQLGCRKPHRDFFRAIESRLEAKPHQLMLIGDSYSADFAGARHAGWQALHLDRSNPTEMPRISSLLDLPTNLESL